MQLNHEIISDDRHIQLYYTEIQSANQLLPAHWHEHLEILCIREGGMQAWSGEQCYLLRPGDIFIASPGTIHFTDSDRHCKYYMLQVPPVHLKRLGADWQTLRFPACIPGETELSRQLNELLRSINALHQQDDSRRHLLMLSRVYELLYLLASETAVSSPDNPKEHSQRDRERIELCMEYVQEHYREPIALGDAAALLSVTPEHFCRMFRRQTGQTFLTYVSQIRMHHFYQDLLHTDYPIFLLLDRNGITNYKAFLKQFRSAYGSSPQQVRRTAKSSPS